MKKETIILNFFGGPGVGKTIIASDAFSALKRNFIKCDQSPEYIKGKLREKAMKVVQNQIYIFGKQQFKLFSLKDDLDVIVTDSPILLSAIYDGNKCPYLKALILNEFGKYRNINYYIQRDVNVPYEQEGRYQDEHGAKLVDESVKVFLDENSVQYDILNGIGKDSLEVVVKNIMSLIENDQVDL
jgi:hypothetical protein